MHDDVVVVLAHRRLALRAEHADHREGHVADAHGLAERIGPVAEQLVDHGLAEHRDLARRCRRRPAVKQLALADGSSCGSAKYSAVVPLIDVVQFCSSLTTWASLRSCGATRRTLGTSAWIAARSSQVRVGRRSRSRRARRRRWTLPGATMSRLVPIAANGLLDPGLGALADRDHRDDRADADDDAERGEERADLVAQDGPPASASVLRGCYRDHA